MQESAQAAHSWARAHAAGHGVEPNWFTRHDVHVHVPAGAVPKDGPSAGITIATAIVSLATDRPVSEDVAMTGEITLTGQVLPVGGIKEKALAAQRAGLTRIVVPAENEPDLEELPAESREALEFVLADAIEDVLAAAFEGTAAASRPRAARHERAAATARGSLPFAGKAPG
jgi:ATP-dependent Lon protease